MKKNRDILLEMAYSRSVFKDKIEEYLGGALSEFLKYKLATKMGETEWVVHWQTEVKNLLRSFYVALQHTTKSKFDKRKAVVEVVEFIKNNMHSWITGAENEVKTDFRRQGRLDVSVEDVDLDEFWDMVWAKALNAGIQRPLKDAIF